MEETQNKEIPSIQISDNKIVLGTMEVPLIVNDKEEMITMQKLAAGKKREVVQKAASTKIVGAQVTGTVDAMGYQIGLLSKVIIKAPFATDEATISSLPDNVLDYLFNEYESWAKPKKKA